MHLKSIGSTTLNYELETIETLVCSSSFNY